MKSLLSVSLLLISCSCNGMFNPGEPLKSPSEILAEIAEFRKKFTASSSFEKLWNKSTKEWDSDASQGERLGSNALLAYMLCDTFLNDLDRWKGSVGEGDEAALGQSGALIAFYQDWSRDPLRFQIFKGSKPEKLTTEYEKMLSEERKKIIADLENCKKHKSDLILQIEFLNTSVIHSKLKSGNIQI